MRGKRAFLLVSLTVGLAAVPSAAQAKCASRCLAGRIRALGHRVGTLESQLGTEQSTIVTLQNQVGTLQTQLTTANQALSKLNTCTFETPLTQYGDPSGTFGYVWDNGNGTGFDTTALDGTATGDPISAWFLIDRCNTKTTAVAHAAGVRARGAIAREAFLRPFSRGL